MARKRKPSKRVRRRRRRWFTFVVTAALALAWTRYGDEMESLVGLAGEPVPAHAPNEHLRVLSWNLANFRGAESGHDLERIRAVVEELDPDVIGVQEIKDREALAALFPGWELALSKRGGAGHQKLGVLYRPERVELLRGPVEHGEISLGGRVRPALSVYLRGRGQPRGPDFWLTVVHLKAMPDAIDQRRQQWPVLVEIAGELGRRDEDLIVLGDFNSTGPRGADGGPAVEHRELEAALGPAGLRRLENAGGCTAYYDGARRDAWKEPSEIDLVWVRSLGEALDAEARVHSGTHCAAERCENFRSTRAYPNRDYEAVSDHCPVVLDLRRADDD